jgi:hypothetical protein
MTEWLLAPQDGLCYMELARKLVRLLVSKIAALIKMYQPTLGLVHESFIIELNISDTFL